MDRYGSSLKEKDVTPNMVQSEALNHKQMWNKFLPETSKNERSYHHTVSFTNETVAILHTGEKEH